MTRTITIPRTSAEPLTVELTSDHNAMFVLGPNGSGKSALLHHLTRQHQGNLPAGHQAVRWVTAHRQMTLPSNRPDVTSRKYREQRSQIVDRQSREEARYKDDYSAQRVLHVLYELLNAERRRQERIGDLYEQSRAAQEPGHLTHEVPDLAGHGEAGDLREVSRLDAASRNAADRFIDEHARPISTLNDLFQSSSLDIRIEATDDREALMARNLKSEALYEVPQLSDGERSALLLAAEVLTVPSGTLLVLDEPERHLHRSIASPLLAGLFAERSDCEFVVSTHEVMLPQDCGDAPIALVRGCTFGGQRASAWDADLLEAGASIPEDVKLDVWGARRTLVFIEGEPHSLDKRIYEAVFPGVTFVSKGGWRQVVNAVDGVAASNDLHWLQAWGLIDRDSHKDAMLPTAARQRVHGLDCHAVESLYYDPMVQQEVGRARCEASDEDFDAVMAALNDAILEEAPVLDGQATVDSTLLRQDIENGDIASIIANYPIKKSGIRKIIASGLQFPSTGHYERAVIVKLRDRADLRQHFASKCGGLQEKLTETGEDEPVEAQPQAAA